jgi:polysaccharide export outer membrane protein
MKSVVICVFTTLLACAAVPAFTQDYVIGTDDVLEVAYWKDKEHSAEVTVRPDGFISLPLISDVAVAGLTPAAAAERVRAKAAEFLQDPVVTVNVKRINSRRVFITGEVARPGAYPITSATTVLQMIATAGGLTDFADRSAIVVIRAGRTPTHFTVNYAQLAKLRNLDQNITLEPGDTIVVR